MDSMFDREVVNAILVKYVSSKNFRGSGPYESRWYALIKSINDIDPSLPPAQITKDKIDVIMNDTYRIAREFINSEGIHGDEVFRTALCGISDHELFKGAVRKWFLSLDYIEDDCSCPRSW